MWKTTSGTVGGAELKIDQSKSRFDTGTGTGCIMWKALPVEGSRFDSSENILDG